MSFSRNIKEEICAGGMRPSLSELIGLTHTCAGIGLAGGVSVVYSTESAARARRIFKIIKAVYGCTTELSVREDGLKKNDTYVVRLTDRNSAMAILDAAGMNIFAEDGAFDAKNIEESDYIRGAFLGSGSVTDPKKNYHLEILLSKKEFSEYLSNVLNRFNLTAKISMRREAFVVYIKDAKEIVEFLTLAGAHTAVLEMENVRIIKNIRNNVNRAINCESANIDKTVRASMRQIRDIQLIEAQMGLDALPENLREIAQLRLEYPDASLRELSELADTSKSSVNHRIRKIAQMADELRPNEQIK